jgi:hypothetical protein
MAQGVRSGLLDLSGNSYGRWTVLRPALGRPKGRGLERFWVCRCSCGTERELPTGKLRSGHSRSCGCLHRDNAKMYCRKHGLSSTREHRIWRSMLNRCQNPRASRFQHYGGRGIGVCTRWRGPQGFENFIRDMGPAPGGRHSIDRINNNANYEPSNCRWATQSEQMRNTRCNHLITHAGRTLTVAGWSEVSGISGQAIHCRLRAGWSEADAVSVPPGGRRNAAS